MHPVDKLRIISDNKKYDPIEVAADQLLNPVADGVFVVEYKAPFRKVQTIMGYLVGLEENVCTACTKSALRKIKMTDSNPMDRKAKTRDEV
ncbi:MAG: hypothetical protein A4E64_01863 [Syntrophorhabdus sp. PtaU1.Bin058]|nr:MAG: hypothetical protein A4E64_01863 [Syntrophorhabdus sp. PtaU1.Bin058]